MATATTTITMRRCMGSARFGIEPHEAPVAEFPRQPSRKDGLGLMCAVHWKAYVKGLAADRKAGATSTKPTTTEKPATRQRTEKEPAPKPEPERIRKARAKLAAADALAGTEHLDAIGSPEVQDALETINGQRHGDDEPDDGQVLVAGVLYDAETLDEADVA